MTFAFQSEVTSGVLCNCSYCARKAALHHRVTADRFVLLTGHDALGLYQFGTLRARHHFCRVCGIHTHCHPRSAPEQVNVNLHCADDLKLLIEMLAIVQFDGRNWTG